MIFRYTTTTPFRCTFLIPLSYNSLSLKRKSIQPRFKSLSIWPLQTSSLLSTCYWNQNQPRKTNSSFGTCAKSRQRRILNWPAQICCRFPHHRKNNPISASQGSMNCQDRNYAEDDCWSDGVAPSTLDKSNVNEETQSPSGKTSHIYQTSCFSGKYSEILLFFFPLLKFFVDFEIAACTGH